VVSPHLQIKLLYVPAICGSSICSEDSYRLLSSFAKMLLSKSKAIPVTGRGGPQGSETSRLPHFLDNRLTDGGEVVSLMRRLHPTPQEDCWYSFLLKAESTSGPSAAEGLGKLKKNPMNSSGLKPATFRLVA
jgi:hypothetical protein